jgi:hypothetical protein
MGSSPARDFVRLVDVTGGKEEVVEGAFLPVEAEYWTPDHTRYTLFFDPGRVKDGILPNRQRGRPLKAGRKYALDIAADWKDANRQPLKSAFRHIFQAGPSEKDAIEIVDWKLAPPAPGTRDPLSVSFATALDRAIVARALGVETAAHARIAGRSTLDENDRRWTFTACPLRSSSTRGARSGRPKSSESPLRSPANNPVRASLICVWLPGPSPLPFREKEGS